MAKKDVGPLVSKGEKAVFIEAKREAATLSREQHRQTKVLEEVDRGYDPGIDPEEYRARSSKLMTATFICILIAAAMLVAAFLSGGRWAIAASFVAEFAGACFNAAALRARMKASEAEAYVEEHAEEAARA